MMNKKHVETKPDNKTKINKKCIIFDYGFFKFEGVKDLVTHIYVRLCKGTNGPLLPSFLTIASGKNSFVLLRIFPHICCIIFLVPSFCCIISI